MLATIFSISDSKQVVILRKDDSGANSYVTFGFCKITSSKGSGVNSTGILVCELVDGYIKMKISLVIGRDPGRNFAYSF